MNEFNKNNLEEKNEELKDFSESRFWAQNIHKFTRGVIGIDNDGFKHEVVLDGTSLHHVDATLEIGRRINCNLLDNTISPYNAGIMIAENGTIVIQIEGDSIMIYLPERISDIQFGVLKEEIDLRNDSSQFAFVHCNRVYDDVFVNAEYLYNYCQDIILNYKGFKH